MHRLRLVERSVRRGVNRLSPYPARVAGEASEPVVVVEAEPSAAAEAEQRGRDLARTARHAAVAALVVIALVAGALALWKVRLVVALLFLAFTLAAAMRPGVESLHRRGVPRVIGVAVHYAALLGLVGLFLWLIVPQAIDQVQAALGENALGEAAQRATGVKHDILAALDRQLRNLPSTSELFRPAVEYGRKAVEIIIGIFFTFAAAAYWMFERDRAVDLVCSLIARPRRKKVRDTWELVDAKLGAFVRGQLVLIVFVGVVLSACFWAIGLPYWLLVGSFAGLVEIVPVIGPLVAGMAAIGVGLTQSVHLAVLAGVIVFAVRLLEDYLVIPKVLGHSVGLSPLVVLVSVTTVGILLGGFAVILAIPIASLVATVIDVVVRNRNPAEEEVPSLRLTQRKTE
jgi:predicted PurR-regulated permease PerM